MAVILLTGFGAGFAQAANTRVSITNFTWSNEPTVDLGESVTWDWRGPDLQHSITGQQPNATHWDSDPGVPMPQHNLGDSFKVTFDQPGQYLFVCKVHPQAVRGTVTVTNQPGDPSSDPGPQAPLRFDLEPPQVEEVKLLRPVLGPKGRGTRLEFWNSEHGTASIDYYRLVKRGKGKKARNVRMFAGYHEAPARIGLNSIRVAHKSPTFRPKPGRYIATFRVDDKNTNSSPNFTLSFEIKGKAKKKK